MATRVLDSWALMAFFKDEPAAGEVEKILIKASQGESNKLLLSVVNWGELYSSIMRTESQQHAERAAKMISEFSIGLVPVTEDLDLVRQAAIYRATKRLSFANCYAAALAKQRNAELLTGDHNFKELEKEIKIAWLA